GRSARSYARPGRPARGGASALRRRHPDLDALGDPVSLRELPGRRGATRRGACLGATNPRKEADDAELHPSPGASVVSKGERAAETAAVNGRLGVERLGLPAYQVCNPEPT